MPDLISYHRLIAFCLFFQIIFKGTVRYAPLALHKRDELGPKDDAESWLYMVVEFLRQNGLPWRTKKNDKEVEEIKQQIRKTPEQLFTDKVGG